MPRRSNMSNKASGDMVIQGEASGPIRQPKVKSKLDQTYNQTFSREDYDQSVEQNKMARTMQGVNKSVSPSFVNRDSGLRNSYDSNASNPRTEFKCRYRELTQYKIPEGSVRV